jgi:hypothetical protein
MGEQVGKGFDGLSFYITDVDAAIAEAESIASGPRSPSSQPKSNSSVPIGPIHQDGGAVASGLKKVLGWVFGIGLILLVKACLFSGMHSLSSGGSSPTYSYDAAKPTDESGSNVSSVGGGDTVGDYNMTVTNEATAEVPAAPDTSTAEITPQITVDNDDGSVMSKPEPGQASLTMPELRYCIAEDIRMSAQKSEMGLQQATDPEKYSRNISSFNEAADNYNNSCSQRSMIASQETTAKSQVEEQRSALEAEGRSRVY